MPKGGKREGSGRKPLPEDEKKKRVIFWLNEDEEKRLRTYLLAIRAERERLQDYIRRNDLKIPKP